MKCTPFLFLLLPFTSNAQGLVGHEPQNRTALLEEYAAIHCGNCPPSHGLADNLLLAYPGTLTAVELHGGALSVPGAGEPDFRSTWSLGFWSYYAIASQPRGAVNRIPVSGQVILYTNQWASEIQNTLALPSPVNIGLASSFDPGPRTLTVDVELYYTGDSPGGNDRISVLLKEDHIIGYQQDYINGAQSAYDHKNILRAYLTDMWGEEVTTTIAGTTVTRTYTFTVPTEWNIANCNVVALVGEYQGELYQARAVAADAGTTTAIAVVGADVSRIAYPLPADQEVRIPLLASDAVRGMVIHDLTGREVRRLSIQGGATEAVVDVSDLRNGTYAYTFFPINSSGAGRLVVVH